MTRLYCAACTFRYFVSDFLFRPTHAFPCPHCGTPMVEDFDPEPQEAA